MQATLFRFLVTLEDSYGRFPELLYHNNVHAADVVQAVHHLLQAPVVANNFTDLEVFGTIIAAAGHDVNHLGLTNNFLINTQAPLAVLYNDQVRRLGQLGRFLCQESAKSSRWL